MVNKTSMQAQGNLSGFRFSTFTTLLQLNFCYFLETEGAPLHGNATRT